MPEGDRLNKDPHGTEYWKYGTWYEGEGGSKVWKGIFSGMDEQELAEDRISFYGLSSFGSGVSADRS